MSELALIFTEPKTAPCACCNGTTTQLTRVVQRDEVPIAIYYALFTDTHPEHHVEAILSLGDFTEGSGPDDREAFALKLRRNDQGVNILLQDATLSPWRDVDLLGTKLTEADAKAHPRADEVFDIGAYAVQHDAALFAHLARPGGCAGCRNPCGE